MGFEALADEEQGHHSLPHHIGVPAVAFALPAVTLATWNVWHTLTRRHREASSASGSNVRSNSRLLLLRGRHVELVSRLLRCLEGVKYNNGVQHSGASLTAAMN